MIISSSRAAQTKCWRRAFNTYHRNLSAPRSMNLVDGSGLHDSVAHGFATKDWDAALRVARVKFDEGIAVSTIPEEQSYLIEDHWDLVCKMVQAFKEGVARETYTVIQPECSIDVPLPGSEHNCIWLHHIELAEPPGGSNLAFEEKWGTPSPQAILERRVVSPHGDSLVERKACSCYVPHRLVGQTDAIVNWNRVLWLLEHKTDSTTGEQFWDQWELDMQPTLYIYGIWKSLGMLPKGVIVNRLSKPSEKQVSAWNQKRKLGSDPKGVGDYIKYERQVFTRTTEDLLRIERTMIDLCNEWEWRILNGNFRHALQRGTCTEWNRKCDFHFPCVCHEEEGSFDGLSPRNMRYDDEKIQSLIQLVTPQ